MNADAARALALALADDELVLGYRESEWTGVAPLLEEDVALSSIAQDEIGHARALYVLAARLDGAEGDEAAALAADRLAYDREPAAFRHARLCERPRGDWGEEIARRTLYELADALRLEALTRSSWTELRELAAKLAREELYHLEHARAWLDRLSADGEGRTRLQAGLDGLWADALGLWEPLVEEERLVADGVLPVGFAALRDAYVAALRAELEPRGLHLPADAVPALGGRRGDHSADFAAQHEEMTSVRRLEPEAAW
jgi:ring-1,2-phenylacetyl-CoA epoxidase subunit PaaC